MKPTYRGWALAAACSLALGAHAAEAPLGSHWRALAEADAAAALDLINENHPGAVPALGDKVFLERLALARRHVQERLPRVDSFAAYSALMNGLAADFKDGHIWSAAWVHWGARQWAGLIPLRRGGKWVVGLHEPGKNTPDLTGAEIAGCDGTSFDRWARERIDLFAGNAQIESELAKRAPALLLNDGDPFAPAPSSCSFRRADGSEFALKLEWRQIAQASLAEKTSRIQKPIPPGMSVTPFAGGYWIRMSTLGFGAADVVTAVREQLPALRAAPMVVLDLRGNGGGNSAYSSEIARLLVGDARADALEARTPACTGSYWRASDTNFKHVSALAKATRARGDLDTAQWYDKVVQQMTAAREQGQAFAPALPACAPQAVANTELVPPASLPPSKAGRLVVFTDRSCFSSCLIATDTFRRLGALHAGETTDMTTRYMEVREIRLPSGMRTFSTLQKVALSAGNFGPYKPDIVYEGAMEDDAAVKAWVAALPAR